MQTIIALLIFLFLPLHCLAGSAVSPTDTGVIKDTLIAVVPADLPPTYFKDPTTGKAAGFAIDVMDEIARRSGMRVEYVFGKPWDEMIEMVRIGKVDVIPHLTISPEREELLDFTDPIEVMPVGLIVTVDSRVTGFSPGLRVGTLKGAVPEEYMRKNAPKVEIVLYEDMTRVLFSLLAGQIDAAFVLNPNLMKLAYEAGIEDKIKALSPPIYEAKRGIALRKDDPAFRDRLNKSVKEFVGTPEYARLFTKWYGHPQPYWTAARTALTMGGGLLLVMMTLLYWRYQSITRLNKKVSAAADALQSTFNAVNDALFIHDLTSGAILDVNSRMCEMYGYGHDEALQLTIADLSSGKPPYTQDDAVAWIRKAAQGEPQLIEWHARRKDGNLFWVEVNMRKASIGGKGRLIVAVRDITERRQAEEKIRESEEKFKNVFDTANDGILIADVETNRFMMGNRTICRMLAYDEQEIKNLSVRDIHPEKDIPYVIEQFNKQAKKELQIAKDIPVIRKDGSLFYADVNSSVITLGDRTYLLGIFRDITEKKKAEEALRESEEFIKNILESVDEGFLIIDRDFRILSANKAYAKMIDIPLEKVIGRHCYEVSHRVSVPCFSMGHPCAVQKVFETRKTHTGVHMHQDAKGGSVHIETKAYPLSKDGSGEVVTAIETLVDITERLKLEDQLHQSQKMESIGTLAGGIAHDFNNILTAIVGYGNIALMKMAKDDPQRLNIEHMLDAGDRAAHLTKDLLLFSRKQVSERKPVDLNEIIRRLEKFLVRVIGEDVDCKTMLSSEAMPVLGDSHQLEQVLMNLATNARDAMPGGGIFTVTTENVRFDEEFITIHGFGKPGNYVLASISDTGKGMDEETRERIFEPFFTTKEVGKGTGLGLAVVYGIIKQHDGLINVYSEPGRGTTFKIYLPLIAAGVEGEKTMAEYRPLGGTETILLAEDDETVRILTRTVLEDFGYKVITANDGQTAVNKYLADRDRIKLLLFDIIMPQMTGKEAYDAISAIQPDIKVLFQSGYAPDIIRQKVLLDDNVAVIYKPISPNNLLTQVREILDRS
ncbi:MAG: PAS domain S-box protein [Nitrospirae bacterium]|nr:PAS domain S-box protein [Nitrospirota bacterium]